MQEIGPKILAQHVAAALAEDVGAGDVTTRALFDASKPATARLLAREELTLAGLELARVVFQQLDAETSFEGTVVDGDCVGGGETFLTVNASITALLSGERTALNYLQRLSGIATMAARCVAEVHGTGVVILDTRKTTPGWRALEKYAVKCGGARNHRRGLDDMVLIKDNHLAALPDDCSLADAVQRARDAAPGLKIEVEADTVPQATEAAAAGADIVLLDNLLPDDLREAVKLIDGRAQTEASGGITLENLRAVAETGVDFISLGALTHSVRGVDIAMEIVP